MRPIHRRIVRLMAAAAIVATALGGLDSLAQAASPRAAENKMILVARQDPGTLDFVKSNLTAMRLWIPANVVEPLVYFNKDGSVEPGVAESWTISDDKLTYVFKIRETTFSDGTPVTADDVVYSLKTMQGSPVVDYAAAYEAVKSIEKVDDHTVKVTLSRPSQNFWQGMGSISGLVQPQANAANIATKPIGTGPYKLVNYTTNSAFEFTANPTYWGAKPAIKDVTVRIITDGTAGLNALEASEVDALPVITIDLWEQLGKRELDKKYSLVTYPQVGEPTYAVLNQKLDKGLRETIARTFDRQSYNDAFGAAWGAENTCTFALPNQVWYEKESPESCPFPYDMEGATKTIAEKGYGSTPLEYASLSDVPDLSLPADIMVPSLQAAGLNVTRNAIDLARYSQLIFQGRPPQFDITVMSGDANPVQWACPDPSKAGWSTYCSAEYTKALADADVALTDQDYAAKMKQAADILRKDAVIIPLIAKKGVGLFDKDLKGFQEPRVAVAIELAKLHW
ncbi:ABC transporter substrate-binding protein [Kaistia dalseonensis]|uniref:Peptide/nickel transport system substrate-binding protein n=1 Tax=Kaistia dalseonensis TaxID=410840 RepID=A0ABU0H4U3_9HYPH|nr:ABC transporter substrate-binding protein [Kaistia dalseonensis]MCX5494748.1 ABC transporter substrate-binding protein [Kaistia dalseonensis]MDQ0437329.1 peptide/nickel transport system substrate-binding protein [Kaistia dalseonensis]